MQETSVIKVDVIIAVYNAETTIEETVLSVMKQEIPDHLIDCLRCFQSKRCDDVTTPALGKHDTSTSLSCNYNAVHFDICICCYNDASADKSLEILQSLEKESVWKHKTSTPTDQESNWNSDITMQMKLLIGTAPNGTTSRGAGYARNQAVRLRDKYETDAISKGSKKGETTQKQCIDHFLCILDSDDIMHPTRIAEQTCVMLSFDVEQRCKTLMGCQFDRIPKDSTQHYTQWANSLSDEQLYLEQFRECTLLQPTWFLTKKWFEQLGGYFEAPSHVISDYSSCQKRARVEPNKIKSDSREVIEDTDAIYKDDGNNENNFYRLFHPSETLDAATAIDSNTETNKKRKINTQQEKSINTLRLAEDSRFFFAHLHARGKLHLHRTPEPLVSYRHRSGMSQSSNTPRKLLLKLRAKAWEDLIFHGGMKASCDCKTLSSNNAKWTNGFAIWGAGRDGKDFLKALSPAAISKVVCFVDVDQKKIKQIKWYDNPALGGRRIPILHFSELAKTKVLEEGAFGRIDKKYGDSNFDVVSKQTAKPNSSTSCEVPLTAKKKNTQRNKKKSPQVSIDPDVLKNLPVVVCVAMYRTNGALESNVSSIGRTEGDDLWHII